MFSIYALNKNKSFSGGLVRSFHSFFLYISTISENVSSVNLTSYWARLEDPVYTFGWERSASGSTSRQLRQANTSMVCRSTGLTDLAQPGAWDNLNISTDGVLFVKSQTLNGPFCFVSSMKSNHLEMPEY
jgi:hypothetical protein